MVLLRNAGRILAAAVPMMLVALHTSPLDAREPLAKVLFGSKPLPSLGPAQSIGFYSKGCMSGGVALPLDGPHWQVTHPSRNRRWGQPAMIRLIERLSQDATKIGWNGLLIGDIAQPRGGPMTSDHASHQIGLDADIWFTPMPRKPLTYRQLDAIDPPSMLKPHSLYVDDAKWTASRERLLKLVASYPRVERILVHPGIKRKLCDTVTGDRRWLRKIRPFWGHESHFHVRIGCQPGSPSCKEQVATPQSDGCDKSLDWWFTAAPWRPAKHPQPKARDVMTMAAMPKACRAVLAQPSPASAAAVTIVPADMAAESVRPSTIAATRTPAAGDVPLPRPRPHR